MLSQVAAAAKASDLRQRILFMFGMFAVYVLGLHIPIPGIDHERMAALFDTGTIFGLLDVFSGGALRKFTIFAMGIMPYINASIIMSLLVLAVPHLEKLQKEGETGRKEIARYTRYLTGVLATVQAVGISTMLRTSGILEASVIQIAQIVVVLVAGTAFLMWLGERITEKGLGNGVSLVIFLGIVASLPHQIGTTVELYRAGTIGFGNIVGVLIILVATVALIVAVQMAQRRIPIQHVKRVIGNRMTSGSSSYLPLKVNSAGVIPIIFAIAIQFFPQTIAQFGGNTWFGNAMQRVADVMEPGNVIGSIIYFSLVVLFTYFYTAVSFNVQDVSDNLKKWGSYIPGIRPGKPTTEYLDRVMTRITLVGATFLGLIALMPFWIPVITGVTTFGLVGGTSLLIMVGVALDTMQAVEAQLVMRHYEGFIK